ncbi:MAG: hypothetical protein WCF12_08300 [Propionicimonas sp.]
MPDQPTRAVIATLADLGHRGSTWAADDIADALTATGPADHDRIATHPAVRAAAHRLVQRVRAGLPPGLDLIGDLVVGPPGTDLADLAHHAVRWKERAAYAEIVAATGLWQPPGTDQAPQVRIEGHADRISPAGHHISHLAPAADVQYWAVYAIGPDGLADWVADFTRLDDARRHADRWHRPATLVCTDHFAALPHTPSTPTGVGSDPLEPPYALRTFLTAPSADVLDLAEAGLAC